MGSEDIGDRVNAMSSFSDDGPTGAGTSSTAQVPASHGGGMSLARGLLMVGGTVVGAVGAWKLLQLGLGNLVAAIWWLAGGVAAHDGVLAPATVVLLVVGARVLPAWLRGPMTVGFVVLGTVTVSAIPVLGRFGARPDNPTLLDRNYVAGWLVFALLVAVTVAAGAWRRRAAARGSRTPGRRTPVR
jgi:hypothetical protein